MHMESRHMTDDSAHIEAPQLSDAQRQRLLEPLPSGRWQQLLTGFSYPFRGVAYLRREAH